MFGSPIDGPGLAARFSSATSAMRALFFALCASNPDTKGYRVICRESLPLSGTDGKMTVFWSNGRHGCPRSLRQNISNARTFILFSHNLKVSRF